MVSEVVSLIGNKPDWSTRVQFEPAGSPDPRSRSFHVVDPNLGKLPNYCIIYGSEDKLRTKLVCNFYRVLSLTCSRVYKNLFNPCIHAKSSYYTLAHPQRVLMPYKCLQAGRWSPHTILPHSRRNIISTKTLTCKIL